MLGKDFGRRELAFTRGVNNEGEEIVSGGGEGEGCGSGKSMGFSGSTALSHLSKDASIAAWAWFMSLRNRAPSSELLQAIAAETTRSMPVRIRSD